MQTSPTYVAPPRLRVILDRLALYIMHMETRHLDRSLSSAANLTEVAPSNSHEAIP
jgi:hypothetical protein